MENAFLDRSYTRLPMKMGAIFIAMALAGSSAAKAQVPPSDPQTALVRQYCAGCHSERGKAGGLSLAAFDAAAAAQHGEVTEKMIRKLRAGMMPPPGARRPDAEALLALAASLETRVDNAAAAAPNPGRRSFQRLNRVEYARAVRDLLALDIDVNGLLPPDSISSGFDNVADSQALSPALMEGYLRAASKVTALAVGDPDAESTEAHYRVPKTASQLRRVEGAPLGTRGGIAVTHTFPADGDYILRIELHGNADGFLFGGPASGEQIDVSINGERRALLEVDPNMAEVTTSLFLKTPPIHIAAGPQRIAAAFIQRFEGPVNDLVAPIDHTLADTQIGVAYGVTTLPHLKDLAILGPQHVTGVSSTPSRDRIFVCRPTTAADEDACATRIVTRLASQAFRHPASKRDIASLLRFYADGRRERDFEGGIAAALEAILASPQFVFRVESSSARAEVRGARAPAGQAGTERLSDIALASRLSFFLWATGPDAELTRVAMQGRLTAPAVLEKQVARMIADPRAESLSTRFAAQWLRLNDVDAMLPDAISFPYYDHTLGEAFVRETELFFQSIVRDDRSVLDLLTADYSYVNERIARHYGIPDVTGPEFRRVALPETRRGLLGHGSVLVLTSVADRTSPVMRGKWIMEVLLGSPPPPPPPNVPALEATSATAGGKVLSTRERMEEHRKNPACQSCHKVIDPLGLALDNFDVTGKWRIKDNGVAIDSAGVMYDGTKIDGPASLRNALLKHQDVFLQVFTENLMTYALGRRVEYFDMPAVRAIVGQAAKTDLHFSSFVLGIVNSAAFQRRAIEAAETTAQAW
jgi:mono/diheme cytochrome c family protein